jgi:DNA mismatch repair ATPase MutS
LGGRQQATEDLPQVGPLVATRAALAKVADEAALPSLGRRVAWSDSGGVMHAICNLYIFYGVHVACAVLNCVIPRREAIIEAVGALADLETLNSLACFAYEQPLACYPTVSAQPRLEIIEGCHPLLAPEEAVPNDMLLTPAERTWIITGSNMAGKSTFLRMVGVNVLLAQIGATPTARRMSWSPHRLLTDLRIKDSLARHESYFLAEVRQLRRMLAAGTDQSPILGLIDEPFRGTNSQERIAAGLAVVRHLIESPHFVLVATHEHQLTSLAESPVESAAESPVAPSSVPGANETAGNAPAQEVSGLYASYPSTLPTARNYHFREDLDESGPVFDYRLRKGPATTRNALRVLEREGYPESLTALARAYMKRPNLEGTD